MKLNEEGNKIELKRKSTFGDDENEDDYED